MEWSCCSANEFHKSADEWAVLNRSSMNLAFFEVEFVSALIEHFFDGDELYVQGKLNGELMFAGFFKPLGKGRWMTAMPSQCPLGMFLCNGSEVRDTVIKGLTDALPGKVAMLDLMQTDSKFMSFLPEQAFETQPYITSGNRPIPEDFDAYFACLGKNMRQNYNKVINRAARAEDVLSTRKVSSPEEVRQAILTYGEIESSGWKNDQGTAISPDNTQGKFYVKALTALAEKGKACCWYYLINEQIVAVDLCIMQDDCLIILKTTYNEEFNKQSPALMLKIEMLKHYSINLNSEGIRNIEFYGKAMEWHKRLDSTLREIQHVTFYPNKLVKNVIKLIKQIKK